MTELNGSAGIRAYVANESLNALTVGCGVGPVESAEVKSTSSQLMSWIWH